MCGGHIYKTDFGVLKNVHMSSLHGVHMPDVFRIRKLAKHKCENAWKLSQDTILVQPPARRIMSECGKPQSRLTLRFPAASSIYLVENYIVHVRCLS